MTQEDMLKIREIFDKSFDGGYNDAMEKACIWLDEHWNDYFGEDEDFNGWHMMRDFRKAMEELRDK